MKITAIKNKAKEMGLSHYSKMRKVDLVHAIQRAEGNVECYTTNLDGTCIYNACCFIDDCKSEGLKQKRAAN